MLAVPAAHGVGGVGGKLAVLAVALAVRWRCHLVVKLSVSRHLRRRSLHSTILKLRTQQSLPSYRTQP